MNFIQKYFKDKSELDIILKNLITDIDVSKILLNENILEYEKNGIFYKLTCYTTTDPEVGPSTRIYLYINDKYKKVSFNKILKVYETLEKSYNTLQETIKKYNL